MQETSDAQLLRHYAQAGDQAAFHQLVTRYSDLVYSAALRQVNSPDLARDVAQSVFTDLAHKAASLADKLPAHLSLAGWLHRGTRYAVLNELRDVRRRRANERQAMEQLITNSDAGAEWDGIRPVLDEALDSLDDEDRDALLLRFFKNLDFRTIGAALGVSDDTAQKRVSRALDRLRAEFNRRGVPTSVVALTAALSANAVSASPAGLAVALSTTALTGATLAATATATATKAIALTTLQKGLLAVLVAIGLAAPLLVQQVSLAKARAQQSTLLAEMRAAQGQSLTTVSRDDDNNRAQRERAELERLRRDAASLRARISQVSAQAQRLVAADASQKGTGTLIGDTLWLANVHDAGQATPAALLQTYAWAVLQGDTNRLAQLMILSPETDFLKLQRILDGIKDEATNGINGMLAKIPISEIRLLEEQPAENNDRWIVHEFVSKDGSVARRVRVRVRLTFDGWKVVFGVNGPMEEAVDEQP